MDKIETLRNLGLTNNQIEIYLALLEHGSMPVSRISDHVSIHRTNIYDNLKFLMSKGLVGQIVVNEKRQYQATDPKSLLDVVKEQQEQVQSILPQLNTLYGGSTTPSDATMLRGKQALKNTFEDFIRVGEPILMYGVPKDVREKLKYYLPRYHKKRIEKKIVTKAIFNHNAKKRMNHISSMPYSYAKYLPQKFTTPASTTIYGDSVAIILWSEDPLIIVVKNKEVADSYRNFFELMWEMAKE